MVFMASQDKMNKKIKKKTCNNSFMQNLCQNPYWITCKQLVRGEGVLRFDADCWNEGRLLTASEISQPDVLIQECVFHTTSTASGFTRRPVMTTSFAFPVTINKDQWNSSCFIFGTASMFSPNVPPTSWSTTRSPVIWRNALPSLTSV